MSSTISPAASACFLCRHAATRQVELLLQKRWSGRQSIGRGRPQNSQFRIIYDRNTFFIYKPLGVLVVDRGIRLQGADVVNIGIKNCCICCSDADDKLVGSCQGWAANCAIWAG